jgi:small conductance mechanosensitive channel
MNLSMASFIRSAMKLILIFLTIILTADILGIPITSFIALLGVFGLAVSLSIQGAFSNMANGVMILITRPFDVGDFIEMPNESGRVVMLNLVHTQLETADKKIIFIPNSMVASSTITNHSLNKTRRSEVKVTASREIPMETVRSVLFEAVASMPVILTDPAPQVLISSFNKYLVHYLVRFWVEAEDVASSTYQLTEVIYEYYEKYNII